MSNEDQARETWTAVAMGGASTVLTSVKPPRNDTRIPAYGHDDAKGHCIAYPFIDDDDKVRMDCVCFSHKHARLIAAAPYLLAFAQEFLADYQSEDGMGSMKHYAAKAHAAIAKALS